MTERSHHKISNYTTTAKTITIEHTVKRRETVALHFLIPWIHHQPKVLLFTMKLHPHYEYFKIK